MFNTAMVPHTRCGEALMAKHDVVMFVLCAAGFTTGVCLGDFFGGLQAGACGMAILVRAVLLLDVAMETK